MFDSAVISAEALNAARKQGEDIAIFDCRFNLMNPEEGRQTYEQLHIEGAYYAHLDDDLSSPIGPTTGRHPLPDREDFAAWLGQRGVSPTTWIVAYDAQGALIASRLWWLAQWIGHERVVVLDGGYEAAVKAGLPLSDKQSNPAPTLLSVGASRVKAVSLEQVERIQKREAELLIDVRAAARFQGEIEPIDPVAGHIPWAKNLPIDQLVTDGMFCKAEELREAFSQLLSAGQEPVFMCGSGVTACQAILAYQLAGYEHGAIYPGSWSEWIRDSQRPIVTLSAKH